MPVIVRVKLGKKSAKLHLTEILSDVYTKPVVHTKRLKIVPEMYEKLVKRNWKMKLCKVKFRYSEKATKIWLIFHFLFDIT